MPLHVPFRQNSIPISAPSPMLRLKVKIVQGFPKLEESKSKGEGDVHSKTFVDLHSCSCQTHANPNKVSLSLTHVSHSELGISRMQTPTLCYLKILPSFHGISNISPHHIPSKASSNRITFNLHMSSPHTSSSSFAPG